MSSSPTQLLAKCHSKSSPNIKFSAFVIATTPIPLRSYPYVRGFTAINRASLSKKKIKISKIVPKKLISKLFFLKRFLKKVFVKKAIFDKS